MLFVFGLYLAQRDEFLPVFSHPSVCVRADGWIMLLMARTRVCESWHTACTHAREPSPLGSCSTSGMWVHGQLNSPRAVETFV